jgi:signal transduction histidine kinase
VECELSGGPTGATHLEARVAPLEGEEHLIVFRDITDQHLARAALEEAATTAVSANRAKSHFLANMSHELRTPLNAIIGYSEMVKEELEDMGETGLVPDLDKINGAGRHLLQLVSDILDLSKIEAGKMTVHAAEFSISSLVEDVKTNVMPMVERNGNSMTFETSEEVQTITTDFMRTKQVLLNLISNAAKFTENGTVTLAIRPEGESAVAFEVRDTGIGMTEDQQRRLFRAFSQASEDTALKYGGTGLGLVLCRRFCQMMGGDVSVKSTPGEGTSFTVVLPRQMPATS